MSAPSSAGPSTPAARDWALAGLIALAAALLYAFTFQTRTFCDGHGLVSLHVLHGEERYQHALYLPLCDVLQGALGLEDPFAVLHLVSVLGGGLGLGAGYLVLRLCGAARFGALLAIGLLGLSPALWFFGTTVHTQALLFGTVACLALLTLLAPWRRTPVALGLVALAFPLLFLTHQSSFTLGPGWVLLVQYARSRQGTRFSWPALLLGVGPLLLTALGVGVLTSLWMRCGSLAPFWAEMQKQMMIESVADAGMLPAVAVWREEWLLPLGVLVPLAVVGSTRLRRTPLLALAVAFLVGVPTLFFLWWGVFEGGGYFLGSDVFLLVPVAFLFGSLSRAKLALGLVLLAGQGFFARARIDAWDTGWDPAARTAQVRAAIGESGLLLTTAGQEPDIRCYLPGVEEFSLTSFVRNTCKHELELVPPERVLAQMKPLLDKLLERNPRVCVELAYPRVTVDDSPITAALAPHLRVIEAYLRERYEVRDVPNPLWPMMVLERKR
ncbi:MAG: hypothetical protein EXS08_01720 [Planctomycetes bacterium]|nr:hypothetical protein [Planctomycetota bacterium]